MAPAYKLTYFDAAGLGEPIRYLFSYGDIEFEDVRVKNDDWPSLKPKTPFGHLPLLEHNGKVLGQSVAIAKYVARVVGLAGKDAEEDLEIDSIVDSFVDFKTIAVQIAHERDETKKAELKKAFVDESVPYYLDRFEAQLQKNNGFFVGGKLTWADIFISLTLDTFSKFLQCDFFSKYPALKKLRDLVVANEKYQKFLSKVKTSEFLVK